MRTRMRFGILAGAALTVAITVLSLGSTATAAPAVAGHPVANATATMPGPGVPTTSPSLPPFYHYLVNRQYGQCMYAPGVLNGGLQLATCTYSLKEQWSFQQVNIYSEPGKPNIYRIRNRESGLCVFVNNTGPGGRVREGYCTTAANVQWELWPSSVSGSYLFVNVSTRLALDTAGGRFSQLAQWPPAGNYAQLWYLYL
ncbi:MAG: RICIN domain-containing protein [Micropruina sp.]|uniref:RICIN domain-containing protein n=1 Tax=Micropruina sp. TaxID=2737536 RepID=UPI0039E5189B